MIHIRNCLIDINILLRLSDSAHSLPCSRAIAQLAAARCQLFYTLQNISEFWNVSTRPIEARGHGLSTLETAQLVSGIESTMTLLPDDARVYAIWRDLVITHNVRGVQVHDAKLAASMLTHGVPHILTLNPADFARYPDIEAVDPSAV